MDRALIITIFLVCGVVGCSNSQPPRPPMSNSSTTPKVQMTKEQSLEKVRKAFAHIPGARIAIENDEMFGEIIKVYVTEDQLDAALHGNGAISRRAAIESGMSVEVVLIKN